MDSPLLSDPDIYPSPEIIFSHLGAARPLWEALFNYLAREQPEMSSEWRYYRDGKSWLLKATLRKKTIFWLSLLPGGFRTTFYFGDKAEGAIAESALSEEMKREFMGGKHYGRIRGLTVNYLEMADVNAAKVLIEIKKRMK
jgi:hypothetical protein